MLSWDEFEKQQPQLADQGRKLLTQFGVGLAFLATIRKDGGPRLHPVCPLLHQGRLYVFVIGESPKCRDLLRDGRYAAQTFPEAKPDSDEFYFTGRAEPVMDPKIRETLVQAATWNVAPTEVLFELKLERAMHTRWLDFGTPQYHSVHASWSERAPLAA